MLAIVEYGVGNLFSVYSSLKYIGIESVITADADKIKNADHVILPGVGAFGDAIQKLRKSGLDSAILEHAKSGKPLLGICLGMQLLYETSCEYGEHIGLGLAKGNILDMKKALKTEKVPHMGWNNVNKRRECPLFKYINGRDYVYYVHSFYAAVNEQTAGSTEYGKIQLTGIMQNGNVFGTQFHPEKSGETGLNILKAFSEL